jgi:hypothetical protein
MLYIIIATFYDFHLNELKTSLSGLWNTRDTNMKF